MAAPMTDIALLRSVGRSPITPGVVGLNLDVAEAVHRYVLEVDEAERIALELLDAVSVQRYRLIRTTLQASISSGSPSCDGSPQAGQAHEPLARSSSACCAERNGPSNTSSPSASIHPRCVGRMRKVPALVRRAYAIAMCVLRRGYPEAAPAECAKARAHCRAVTDMARMRAQAAAIGLQLVPFRDLDQDGYDLPLPVLDVEGADGGDSEGVALAGLHAAQSPVLAGCDA